MRFLSLTSCIATVFTLVACAFPTKTSSPYDTTAGKISSVEVVLEPPAFVPISSGLAALETEGWSSGELETKFCDEMISILMAEGIEARCMQGAWGKRMTFGSTETRPISHVISIQPRNLGYLVAYQYQQQVGGSGAPQFDAFVRITNKQTGALAWAGQLRVIFAPVDRKGARRFTSGLINALREAGAIATKQ